MLPQLRQYLEAAVDEIVTIDDQVMQRRRLDRLRDEAEQRLRQAEVYLTEAGARRVSRSNLLRWVKLVPFLSGPVGGAQGIAANSLEQGDLPPEPLAYLAFARAELAPVTRYKIDPFTGIPLVEVMSRHPQAQFPRTQNGLAGEPGIGGLR